MSVALLPGLLAGLAVLVALGLPGGAGLRLQQALPSAARVPAPGRPTAPRLRVPPVVGRVLPGLLAAAAGLAVGGVGLALVAAVLLVAGTAGLAARRRAARAAAERAGAVEACAVLASELRAGRAPGQALEAAVEVAAGPLAQRLSAAAAVVRFGGDPAAGLLTAPVGAEPTAVPEVVAGLAACWQVCAGTGSGLAAAVERLEEGVRSGEASRRAVEAELAGPRATASLLALLPVAGIAMAAALGARPLHVLLGTTAGTACLVAGVALDLAGVAWTRRIAARAGG